METELDGMISDEELQELTKVNKDKLIDMLTSSPIIEVLKSANISVEHLINNIRSGSSIVANSDGIDKKERKNE